MEYNIVDMKVAPDDVNVGVSPSFAETLHEVFQEVKLLSMAIASVEPDVIIDLGENSEGLPSAEIFRNGSLERKVFATFS